MKKIIGILLCMLLIAVPILSASEIKKIDVEETSTLNFDGTTLYVGGSGGGNYSTIQEAIDASVSGDTVFVYDDSSPYNENIRINKQISVIGEDKDTTVINGVSGDDFVVRIAASNTMINRFTIVGKMEMPSIVYENLTKRKLTKDEFDTAKEIDENVKHILNDIGMVIDAPGTVLVDMEKREYIPLDNTQLIYTEYILMGLNEEEIKKQLDFEGVGYDPEKYSYIYKVLHS